MVAILIIEILLGLVIFVTCVTQIIIPLVTNKPLFPILRSKANANNLDALKAENERVEHILEEQAIANYIAAKYKAIQSEAVASEAGVDVARKYQK